uniref:Endo/exonuclease/phosphatase domain-containing protein n=1 Tax=Haemonchus contortus TaxID=6289 RepID=A0A7I4YMI8_HAECO
MAISTFNARTLASEACIEDLMLQARKIKYDIIVLTETRRHRPLLAVFETGEELFLERATLEASAFRRWGSTPALAIFVAYAPTSSYDEEELEAFSMDPERLYREDHAFFNFIVVDFDAEIGPKETSEELHIRTHGMEWNEQCERLSEVIMSTHTIHGISQFKKPIHLRWT